MEVFPRQINASIISIKNIIKQMRCLKNVIHVSYEEKWPENRRVSRNSQEWGPKIWKPFFFFFFSLFQGGGPSSETSWEKDNSTKKVAKDRWNSLMLLWWPFFFFFAFQILGPPWTRAWRTDPCGTPDFTVYWCTIIHNKLGSICEIAFT